MRERPNVVLMTEQSDHEREQALADLAESAQERGVRIAVAESLTSGRIASRIGAGEGAADWFAGGVVAYQMRTKERVLGVGHGLDPCSAEVAEQLAAGVRELLGADLAVAATGVGGPDPQDGHAPGTVYLGWADANGRGHVLFEFDGDPVSVMDQSVDAAVTLLHERLGLR